MARAGTNRPDFGDDPMACFLSLLTIFTAVMHFQWNSDVFNTIRQMAAYNAKGIKKQSSAEVYALYRVLFS